MMARAEERTSRMDVTLHRRLAVCGLAGTLALLAALVMLLPRAASAAPPDPVTFPPLELGEEYCGFPVLYEVSGKTKVINLPSGDTLFKNLGGRVTLTNLDTGEQVSSIAPRPIRLTESE